MDKSTKFMPTKEEACKLADNYWADLTGYREKTLNRIKDLITSNASIGKYEITCDFLKTEKDYIKEKLEDVGYKVELLDCHTEDKYIFMKVSFGKK